MKKLLAFLFAFSLLLGSQEATASYTPPDTNYLNLLDYSLPTGNDDTTAINAVLASAKSQDKSVYAPCGSYKHSGLIIVDSVRLFGDGSCTIFEATSNLSTPLTAIKVTGSEAYLDHLSPISDWSGSRQGTDDSTLVEVIDADNFSVDHIIGDTSPTAGIVVDNSFYGEVTHNNISNTLADGVLVQKASAHVIASENIVTNPGDTCVSVSSYVASGLTHDVNIEDNTCYHGILTTSGYTACGGKDINISGNNVENLIEGSGVYVFAGGSSGCTDAHSVNIIGNTINVANGSVPNLDVRALTLRADNTYTISAVNIIGNSLTGAQGASVAIGDHTVSSSTHIKDIIISNNYIGDSQSGGGTTAPGILLDSGSDINIEGNIFASTGSSAISGGSNQNSGFIKITGNDFHDINSNSGTGQQCINLFDSGFTTIYVEKNTQKNGSYTFDSFLLEHGTTNLFVSENVTENTSSTYSATLPAIASGFCTSPSIGSNSTPYAFTLTIGSSCGSGTGTINMPTAYSDWICNFQNITNPGSNVVGQTGGGASTVTVTNYSRTTGSPSNFTNGDTLRISCLPH